MLHRLLRPVALVATMLVALSCDRMSRGVAAADKREMARAERIMDSLIVATRTADTALVRPQEAIALGYLERLRLGLGSPYRVMAYALHDPRLSPTMRRQVGWSLLARVARGDAYSVPDDALDFLGDGQRGRVAGTGAKHRALIDSVIATADNPRAGEEAIRLAYTLARAEQTVWRGSGTLANYAAAAARDRRLAAEDARRLLRTANRNDDDALRLLEQWRAERLFRVERPLLADEAPDPATVVSDALHVLEELRELSRVAAARSDAPTDSVVPVTGVASAEPAQLGPAATEAAGSGTSFPGRDAASALPDAASYLSVGAARRLASLASAREAPPQAPVAVTMGAYRRRLQQEATKPEGRDDVALVVARRRFATSAVNEETFAAEYALLRQTGASAADHGLLALAVATAMRPYAQEEVWFAEFGGPSAAEVAYNLGLRAVEFDATVPKAWRPYYLRQLATAAGELRRVLPAASLSGLTVRFGESVKRDTALALHDPRTRTIYLPTATGAGTIAHELTHDLDWQTARTQLAVRGTYSTDRVARNGQSRLGNSVRGLTAARPTSDPFRQRGATERPAEVLARSADWFVAAALAREGRMDGYLTSVQDEVITGYAGSTPPDARGDVGEALIDVLSDMTLVPAATREWFLQRYGRERRPSPLALARQVLGVSPNSMRERSQSWMGATPLLAVAPSQAVYRYEPRTGRPSLFVAPAGCATARHPDDAWRATLLRAAAESRATGILRDRTRRWHGLPPAPRHQFGSDVLRQHAELRAWMGGPWQPELADSAVRRLRDGVLRELARQEASRGPAASPELAWLIHGTCAR